MVERHDVGTVAAVRSAVRSLVAAVGRRSVWSLTLLVVLTAGCAASTNDDATPSGAASPLDAYLGRTTDLSSDEIQEFQRAEDLIAECMRAEGFEYQPLDVDGIVTFYDPEQDFAGLEYGSEEWIERFGFGVTTLLPVALEGADYNPLKVDELIDPNQSYVSSLDDAGRNAYYDALTGSQDGTDQGCAGSATSGADDGSAVENDFYAVFGDRLLELQERIDADPRVIEDQKRAARCIAEKGSPYTTSDGLASHLYALQEEINEAIFDVPWDDPIEQAIRDQSTADGADDDLRLEVAFDDEDPLEQAEVYRRTREALDDTVASANDEEIRLATIFHDCGMTFAPVYFSDVHRQVEKELEQAFIGEHQSELERFREG
ncbi:MAG: hypothetical protein AAGD35_19420 [Actinomycetota bacterium]